MASPPNNVPPVPAATFPLPPPLGKIQVIDLSTGRFTTLGLSFMTQLWAGIQGDGGVTQQIAELQTEVSIIFGMHGDATLTAEGVITVTSSEGRAFVASAFIDTTDADNITSGTLAPARLPIATDTTVGAVKPDGTTITIAPDGTISSAGSGTGTVTSVSASVPSRQTATVTNPTTTPAIAIADNNQADNTVFAGPASGGSGTPGFRALVAADIPSLSYLTNALPNAQIFVGNGSGVAAAVPVSGDATLSSAGAFAVIGSGGVAFGSAAFTSSSAYDAAGAAATAQSNAEAFAANSSNQTSGTLPNARLSAVPNSALANSAITIDGVGVSLGAAVGSKTANFVYAGPSSGSASAPTFRALVAADLPSGTTPTSANPSATAGPAVINGSAATFMRSDAAPAIQKASNTQFGIVEVDGTTITSTAGVISTVHSGTVTSVALSAPAEFTVSGSPVTGAGTLAFTKATQAANLVWAGPTSGAAAAPAFRSLVSADIPALAYAPSALASGSIFIGSVGGVATAQAMSGDVTITLAGATTVASMKVGSTAHVAAASAATGALVIVSTTVGGLLDPSFVPAMQSWSTSAWTFGAVAGSAANFTATLQAEGGTAANLAIVKASANNNPPLVATSKARGSLSAPTAVLTNDPLGNYQFYGYGATGYQLGASIAAKVLETSPSDTAMGSQIQFRASPLGSVTPSTLATVDPQSGLAMSTNIAYSKQRVTAFASGASLTVNNNTDVVVFTVNATRLTGTIIMPAAPVDGQIVRFAFGSLVITTLALQGNTGQTIDGALTSSSANSFASYVWDATSTTWYRIG